jgi:hypothetical protein
MREPMSDSNERWLLKNKIVCDFRGFPIGRIRKVWYDQAEGPMVIVERSAPVGGSASVEAIPMRAIDSVTEHVRLKPPVFAE